MYRKGVVLSILVLLLTACGDDGAAITTPVGTTATTGATTLPPTTIAPPSSTTAIPAPPTTATVPPSTLGPPPLPQVLFLPDGIGFAAFGDDPDAVIGIANILWGSPTSDTGVLPSEFHCPGTQYRKVLWTTTGGEITLMFSDDAPWSSDGGPLVFTAYGYQSPGAIPLTAGPPASVDIGTSVAELLAMWPAGLVEASEFTGEEIFRYTPGFATGILLTGRLTGLTPTDTLLDVWGGRGCLGDEPGAD